LWNKRKKGKWGEPSTQHKKQCLYLEPSPTTGKNTHSREAQDGAADFAPSSRCACQPKQQSPSGEAEAVRHTPVFHHSQPVPDKTELMDQTEQEFKAKKF
jgi:hypothetical protein